MAAFVVDDQLPPSLARRLVSLGHDATHLFDLGMTGASDSAVVVEAQARRAIIVTKDEDFVTLSKLGQIETAILWIRLGKTTNKVLWAAIEPRLEEAIAAFEAGEKVVEIR